MEFGKGCLKLDIFEAYGFETWVRRVQIFFDCGQLTRQENERKTIVILRVVKKWYWTME